MNGRRLPQWNAAGTAIVVWATAEDLSILRRVATRIAGEPHSLIRSQIFERSILADRRDASVMANAKGTA